MSRRFIMSSALIFGLLCFVASSAVAQKVWRAERTFFIKPQVGLSHYWGDWNEGINPGFGDDANGFEGDGAPWSAGLEVGYQISTRFSLSGATNLANYPFINDPAERDSDEEGGQRLTHQLWGRWTFQAAEARVAPFIQFGVVGTEPDVPNGSAGLGPAVGFGLDIALSDQAYLVIEEKSFFASPDDAIDNAFEIDGPSFDVVSFLGIGLKWNLRSPFTAVDVMSAECPNQLMVGESATFTATSNSDVATPPVTYEWNWGDGTTANGAVATRTYNRPGTYTVTFTATNDGHSDSESCIVNVIAQPVPPEVVSLNASQTRFEVCEPVTVDFTADVRGDTPITYTWDFGDGSSGAGGQASHTYTEPGTYTVRLTAENEHGEATRTMTITAEPCTAGICYDITEMNSVFFGRNSSTLTTEARAALQENLDIFEECPNLCARIEGFAGPGERNPQQLSEARGRAVEQFYVDNGIAASRFVTTGRGMVGETTSKKEGTSQFRRVDTLPVQCVDLR